MDHQQLNDILLLDLQDMANRPELLEQHRNRRFNRDEPPPYRSPSPEDDDEQDNAEEAVAYRIGLHPPGALEEIKDLINQPLSETELRQTQANFEALHSAYRPGPRYEDEALSDRLTLLRDRGMTQELYDWLGDGLTGWARRAVYSRHRIKKRWQKLGVWNPEWGIPGRVNEGPRDKPSEWKWKWQGDTPVNGVKFAQLDTYDPDHPNSRAIHLREGLHRGERQPLPPRHNLAPDASQSEAESFITSRPWYICQLDMEEEKTRLNRIPLHKQVIFDMDHKKHVAQRWEEDETYRRPEGKKTWYSWKWNHESPSPDPEDLDKIELTPSEVDAIDAIPPPPSPPPPPPVPLGLVQNPFTRLRGSIFGPRPEQTVATDEARSPVVEMSSPEAVVETSNPEASIGVEDARSAEVVMSDPEAVVETSKSEASIGSEEEARSAEAEMPDSETVVEGSKSGASKHVDEEDDGSAKEARPGDARLSPPPPKPTQGRPRGRPKGSKSKRDPVVAKPITEASNVRRSNRIADAPTAAQPVPTEPRRARGEPTEKHVALAAGSGAGTIGPSTPKRGRGRPPKAAQPEASKPQGVVKRRGRPPKTVVPVTTSAQGVAKKRGRPPKAAAPESSAPQVTPKKRGRPPKVALPDAPGHLATARPRGRPPKTVAPATSSSQDTPKKRGRPAKTVLSEPSTSQDIAKKRGRPPKAAPLEAPEAPDQESAPKRRGRPPKAAAPPAAPEPQSAPRPRGRPPKTASSDTSGPQQAVKMRGRPAKAAVSSEPAESSEPPVVAKKRGRPAKAAVPSEPSEPSEPSDAPVVTKKRGRPAKADQPTSIAPAQGIPRKRGRPAKATQPEGSKPQGVVKRRGRPRKTT